MIVRPEQDADHGAIREVIRLAFANHPHSTQNEHRIVDALRAAKVLSIALVAEEDHAIAGFVACSPVTVDGERCNWVGLGPIAVRPDRQRQGVGIRLMRSCIESLKSLHVGGIVLLGDPAYYERFGFVSSCDLTLPGVPASHFMSLHLAPERKRGVVAYHSAFAIE